jgi:hypothetical protein
MTKKAVSQKVRRGAPPKFGDGLDKVLYIRVNDDLLRDLDRLTEQARCERRGRAISRADVAREILYRAVAGRDDE